MTLKQEKGNSSGKHLRRTTGEEVGKRPRKADKLIPGRATLLAAPLELAFVHVSRVLL